MCTIQYTLKNRYGRDIWVGTWNPVKAFVAVHHLLRIANGNYDTEIVVITENDKKGRCTVKDALDALATDNMVLEIHGDGGKDWVYREPVAFYNIKEIVGHRM